MKFYLTLLISGLFLTTIMAQVLQSEQILSLGMQNAFVVDHEGADEKMVYKFLEDYYDDYGKVKNNRKAREWNCRECKIPLLASQSLNVYFKVQEGKGMTTSYHFFDDGTKFISKTNDWEMSEKIESFLLNIKHEIRRKVLEKELEDQKEKLDDLNKDLEDLMEDNKDLHEDIEEYHKKIREAEKKIKENLERQADKRMELEKQRRVVNETGEKFNSVGRD